MAIDYDSYNARLEAATTKAEGGSEIIYNVANGNDTSVVSSDSGDIPTLSKFLKDKGTDIDLEAAESIAKLGYNIVGDFADLPTVTNASDVITSKAVTDYEDALWRYIGGSLPYTPTGTDPNVAPEEGKWVAVVQAELKSIARYLNVADSAVIYSTDTVTPVGDGDGVSYVYNATTQVTYALPSGIGAGETITDVTGSALITTGGSYTLKIIKSPYTVTTSSMGITASTSDAGIILNELSTENMHLIIDTDINIQTTFEPKNNMILDFKYGSSILGSVGVTSIFATGLDSITTINLNVDGGATGVVEGGNARGVRFVNCTRVTHKGVTRVDNPFDWGCSHETCDYVTVESFECTHSYDVSVSGGRDGIHFLDCLYIKLDKARGNSGDDLVSVTVEFRDTIDVHIRDVIGHSNIANVVLCGKEGATTNTYNSVIDIQGVYQDENGSKWILGIEPNSASPAKVILRDIGHTGNSTSTNSYGVYVNNISGKIHHSNINVASVNQHGVHFLSCTGDIYGENTTATTSAATTYDGINYTSCKNIVQLTPTAEGCPVNGLSIVTCDGDIYVSGYKLRNNGGINLRITDCKDVFVGDGNGVSDNGITTTGLLLAGNDSGIVSTSAVFNAIDSYAGVPAKTSLSVPTYTLKGKDEGTLITQSQYGGSAVKNSTGNYTVTFTTALPSTNYMVFGNANGGVVDLPAAQSTTGFTFDVKDYTGANIDSNNFSIQVISTSL